MLGRHRRGDKPQDARSVTTVCSNRGRTHQIARVTCVMKDVLAIILGGGQGKRLYPLDPSAFEAGRADRRQVPAHRHPDQQLPARRSAAHLRADAVQLGVAQPPHRADLSARPVLATASSRSSPPSRRRRTPTGSRARPTPSARRCAHFLPHRGRVLPDPRRRSPLSHGLRRADRRAHRAQGATSPSPPSRSTATTPRDGHLPLRHGRARSRRSRRSRTATRLARDRRAACRDGARAGLAPPADKPFVASMGIYVFSRDVLLRGARASTRRRFRPRDHPAALSTATTSTPYFYRGYWADVGTIAVVLRRQHHADAAGRAVQLLRSDAADLHARRASCRRRGSTAARSTRSTRRRRRASMSQAHVEDSVDRHPDARCATGAQVTRSVLLGADYYERAGRRAPNHAARHRPRLRARSGDRRQERAHRRRRAAGERARASRTADGDGYVHPRRHHRRAEGRRRAAGHGAC